MKALFFLLGFLLLPQGAQADERCGPGLVYDTGVVGCVQEFCPAGSGRNYSGVCQCPNGDNGTVRQESCRNDKGLLTHCAPAGRACTSVQATFDPVTGKNVAYQGTYVPATPEPESDWRVVRFFQRIFRGYRDQREEVERPRGSVVLGVMGKFWNTLRGK